MGRVRGTRRIRERPPETLAIRDLAQDGRGVAVVESETFFVHGALPGERVLAQPMRRKRKVIEADLVDVVESSPDRITPHCEYFGRCGGCALQHLDSRKQFELKTTTIKETLRRIGGVEPRHTETGIEGPSWHYRRRARLGVKFVPGKGRVLVGFRERSAPYVTDMGHCKVLAKPVGDSIADLAELIGGMSIKTRVPQVEVAVGDQVTAFVFRVLEAPSVEDLVLLRDFGSRWDATIHLQTGGPETVSPLDEGDPLSYRLDNADIELRFGPTDFVQVNAVVNEKMVGKALELLDPSPSDRVLDLFCGLGNFSLPLAKRSGFVYGVEGAPALVERGRSNAVANGVENIDFQAQDLNEGPWGFSKEQWDLVLLDPPRTGAAALVSEMRRLGPRRVLYVSCNPGTLARDAATLGLAGYRLDTLVPVDMFPQTHHVEAMALFVDEGL